MSTQRLLATETLDPSGPLPRWITPAIRRLGWRAWALPTLEAVHLLGPTAYAAMVVQIVDQLRPHVLLVHPPYDFLSSQACREIQGRGTRIVGLDCCAAYGQKALDQHRPRDPLSRFDLFATTAPNDDMSTDNTGVRSVPFAMAPESVAFADPSAPAFEAVLLGCATKANQATARAVAEAGVEIACFGPGWATGQITRPSALGLMQQARFVISPVGNSQAGQVRMIEAALLGARQIIEYSPALEPYLAAEARPVTYRFAGECAQKLTADKPLPTWFSLPTWEEQWPQLLADLPLVRQPERTRSPALEQLYASLAHLYEGRGAYLAAAACQAAWAYAAPGEPGPILALTRCLYLGKRWKDAADLALEAGVTTTSHSKSDAVNLPVFVPSGGPNVGATGAIDPGLDMLALRIDSLARDGRLDKACTEARSLPAHSLEAVQAAIHRLPYGAAEGLERQIAELKPDNSGTLASVDKRLSTRVSESPSAFERVLSALALGNRSGESDARQKSFSDETCELPESASPEAQNRKRSVNHLVPTLCEAASRLLDKEPLRAILRSNPALALCWNRELPQVYKRISAVVESSSSDKPETLARPLAELLVSAFRSSYAGHQQLSEQLKPLLTPLLLDFLIKGTTYTFRGILEEQSSKPKGE